MKVGTIDEIGKGVEKWVDAPWGVRVKLFFESLGSLRFDILK